MGTRGSMGSLPAHGLCMSIDVWQGGASGWHTDKSKQQFPDLSTGCASSVQVIHSHVPATLLPRIPSVSTYPLWAPRYLN